MGTICQRIEDAIDPHGAEYAALFEALRLAHDCGVRHLRVLMDSAVVVYQMEDEYEINADHLRRMNVEARKL